MVKKKTTPDATPLFADFINEVSKSKHDIVMLKNMAVKRKQLELAAYLRDIENSQFPVTKQQKVAEKIGEELSSIFGMVNLNTPPNVAYTIFLAVNSYKTKLGQFSLKDAAEIRAKTIKIFGE